MTQIAGPRCDHSHRNTLRHTSRGHSTDIVANLVTDIVIIEELGRQLTAFATPSARFSPLPQHGIGTNQGRPK
jgi:hypothetical protein